MPGFDWHEDKPEHKHDCSECIFLGNYWPKPRQTVDLYICKGPRETSLIARYGSDGPEYCSGPIEIEIAHAFDGKHGWVKSALKRALQDGHISIDDLGRAIESNLG